MNQAEMSESND